MISPHTCKKFAYRNKLQLANQIYSFWNNV